MKPIGIDYRKGKGEVIRQKCQKCGKEMVNMLAPDDDVIGFVRMLHKEKM
jgi:hypothetical protein